MENNERSQWPKGRPFWKEAAIAVAAPLGLVILFALCGYFQNGPVMAERAVRGFILPCGILWLLMATVTIWAWLRRQYAISILGIALFLAHGFFGGEIFSVWLSQRLEASYEFVDPASAEHFDLIVVLGGGTKSGGLDHAAFSFGGDRVGLALRLFHAGKADQILFTGSNLPWETKKLSPAETSKRLATELGVPAGAIRLGEGHNTFEEFRSLKEELKSLPNAKVGLVTSATHMSRAMRLATSAGLSMIPIPADFERRAEPPTFLSLIPSAAGYRMTERSCVEYLAWLVGR